MDVNAGKGLGPAGRPPDLLGQSPGRPELKKGKSGKGGYNNGQRQPVPVPCPPATTWAPAKDGFEARTQDLLTQLSSDILAEHEKAASLREQRLQEALGQILETNRELKKRFGLPLQLSELQAEALQWQRPEVKDMARQHPRVTPDIEKLLRLLDKPQSVEGRPRNVEGSQWCAEGRPRTVDARVEALLKLAPGALSGLGAQDESSWVNQADEVMTVTNGPQIGAKGESQQPHAPMEHAIGTAEGNAADPCGDTAALSSYDSAASRAGGNTQTTLQAFQQAGEEDAFKLRSIFNEATPAMRTMSTTPSAAVTNTNLGTSSCSQMQPSFQRNGTTLMDVNAWHHRLARFYKWMFGTRVYGIITPTSIFFGCWNIVFMIVLSYELIMFPLAVFDLPKSKFLANMALFTLAFWFADVMVSCSVAFHDADGELIQTRRGILAKYAKTWMFTDLLLLLVDFMLLINPPGESGENGSGSDVGRTAKLLRMTKSLRFLRVLRVLRLRKLGDAVRLVDEFFNSEVLTILKSLLYNVITILVISHFLGSYWFWMGSQKYAGLESWVYHYKFNEETWEYQYLTSLHWAMCQMTPGGMHVQPQNPMERLSAIAVLVLGMIIFSSIVSSITAATNQLKGLNAKYDKQRWCIRRFFRERQISVALITRVLRYSDAMVQPKMRNVMIDEVILLRHLPQSMYMDLMLELYDQDIMVHPFFMALNQTSTVVMQNICGMIEMIALAEGDYLFHWGEAARSMYFVVRGELKYESDGGTPKQRNTGEERHPATKIKRRGWVCEAVLWTDWVHTGSVQALTDSEVIGLDNEKFQAVLHTHRAHIWLAKKYGQEFIRQMNLLSAAGEGPEEQMGQNPALRKLKSSKSGVSQDFKSRDANTLTDMLVVQVAIETLPETAQETWSSEAMVPYMDDDDSFLDGLADDDPLLNQFHHQASPDPNSSPLASSSAPN